MVPCLFSRQLAEQSEDRTQPPESKGVSRWRSLERRQNEPWQRHEHRHCHPAEDKARLEQVTVEIEEGRRSPGQRDEQPPSVRQIRVEGVENGKRGGNEQQTEHLQLRQPKDEQGKLPALPLSQKGCTGQAHKGGKQAEKDIQFCLAIENCPETVEGQAERTKGDRAEKPGVIEPDAESPDAGHEQ